MKNAILSFFLFGAILSAAPVSVSLTSGGANNSVYGPYTLNVAGKNYQAMCMDDFLTSNVGAKYSWKANETAVSGSNFSNTYLGNLRFSYAGQDYTSKDVYTAEAYLFSELIQPGADRQDIQDAAWAIMDPKTLQNISSNSNAENYLLDTFANYKNFNTTGYEIISDINRTDCDRNQEFMIKADAPEPATFALLGGGLFAAGLARFFRRKKQTEVND